VARVRALGRRVPTALPPVLTSGDITLEPAKRLATRGGRPLTLTPKEFGVLEVLLSANGQVVSAEELLDRVWDENADPFTNAIRITVMTLRRKLGEPAVIDTVVGAGYRMGGD
jgi:DNA-binding response OmpR family regulator